MVSYDASPTLVSFSYSRSLLITTTIDLFAFAGCIANCHMDSIGFPIVTWTILGFLLAITLHLIKDYSTTLSLDLSITEFPFIVV
jgi:hypothetical protein